MDQGSSVIARARALINSGRPVAWPATVAVLCAALLWFGAVEWADHAADRTLLQTPMLLRAVAVVVFVTGGLLQWARWRLYRTAESARAAVVLLALAASPALVPTFGSNLSGTAERTSGSVAVHVIVRALLLVLIFSVLRAGRTRPLRDAGSVLAVWAVLVGVVLPLVLPAGELGASPALAAVLEVTVAVGWVLLFAARCRRRAGAPATLEITVVVLLCLCEIARAWSVLHPQTGPLPALVLQVAAAGMAVGLAGRTLYIRVLATQPSVRAHDSRSALAAVSAATDVLAALATAERAGNVQQDVGRLQQLVRAEMGRIERVLLGGKAQAQVDFDIAQTLAPVVLGHTLAGGRAVLSFDLGEAHGDPWTTAAVVDAALENVRSHAPGASVTIGLEWCGPQVRILIDDDGPGIDPADRARVLRYGVRGSEHGPGTGIGLYSAARAMDEQGGRLELGASPNGGLRVTLTLPCPVLVGFAVGRAS